MQYGVRDVDYEDCEIEIWKNGKISTELHVTSNVEMAMKIIKNYKGSHKKVKVNSVEKYINFMEKQLLA